MNYLMVLLRKLINKLVSNKTPFINTQKYVQTNRKALLELNEVKR